MQIFVNCAGSRLVDVTADTTVEDVYTMVAEREGLCPSQVYLVNQGRVLESGTLLENGVNHLSIVNASVRLAGGKVHGSLARAGKVKGQTPKVEKSTDKKKKTTGRAKRRAQYNKRFVNVVVGFGGKKRGPNSNTLPGA